jgi:iron complex transport system ATP-binding protein
LTEARLDLDAVEFGYGREPVIHGVSLSVRRGEFLGLIGPNGSGKSSLLRLMSGTVRPWRGRVLVDGRPVESYRRRELSRLLAVVPQETAVNFPFSVAEVVLFGRTPHLGGFGFEGDRDLEAARRVMERTGVTHLAGRAITELSGGERQRVILARALAQEPSVLLLDEPSAFLDLRHQVEIYDLLGDLRREGLTIVTVSHDLNLAALYCGRVVLLKEGRVACAGEPAEVMSYSMLTEVYGTEVYVSMNDITGTLNVLPLSREHRERLRQRFPRRP